MVDFIYKFKFTDCQRQSAKSDLIRCPNDPSWEVDLHKVAPGALVADSLLISSQLRIFSQYETALMNFSIGLGLGDYEWCNRRLHLKERL